MASQPTETLSPHAMGSLGAFARPALSVSELEKYCAIGRSQLAEHLKTLPNTVQETKECLEFHEWAVAHKNVKFCAEPIKFPWLPESYTCEIVDYAPKGKGLGDDEVYATNRDVWEKLPRGCAMMQIKDASGQVEQALWAVRGNRKFTGHEDDSASHAVKLYHVGELPPTSAVITLKENGSVVHLSARDIELREQKLTLVFIGSKKVHVGVLWPGDKDEETKEEDIKKQKHDERTRDLLRQLELFCRVRHELVAEMGQTVFPLLHDKLVRFLADNRLVINSEYCVPVGSGPIDNAQLHGLTEPRAFAFSLVPNNLAPHPSCELCLHPIFALEMMKSFGWQVVNYIYLSEEQYANLQGTTSEIAKMPNVEGAVIYHLNSLNIAMQLEKSKASGYVVVRALREKARGMLYGRKKHPGLLELLERKSSEVAFEAWKEPQLLINKWVERSSMAIHTRIDAIDHIPLSESERQEWKELGAAFMQWIAKNVSEGAFSAKDFMNNYSANWTKFYKEFKTKA